MSKRVIIDVDKAIETHNSQCEKGNEIDRNDVAREINVSYQTLVNWKNGRVPEAAKKIVKLSNFTGEKVGKILKQDEQEEN